jgi:hypothetical protein
MNLAHNVRDMLASVGLKWKGRHSMAGKRYTAEQVFYSLREAMCCMAGGGSTTTRCGTIARHFYRPLCDIGTESRSSCSVTSRCSITTASGRGLGRVPRCRWGQSRPDRCSWFSPFPVNDGGTVGNIVVHPTSAKGEWAGCSSRTGGSACGHCCCNHTRSTPRVSSLALGDSSVAEVDTKSSAHEDKRRARGLAIVIVAERSQHRDHAAKGK